MYSQAGWMSHGLFCRSAGAAASPGTTWGLERIYSKVSPPPPPSKKDSTIIFFSGPPIPKTINTSLYWLTYQDVCWWGWKGGGGIGASFLLKILRVSWVTLQGDIPIIKVGSVTQLNHSRCQNGTQLTGTVFINLIFVHKGTFFKYSK